MQTQLISRNDPFIKKLKELGILRPLDRRHIKKASGLILIGCSDKNRFFDLFVHVWLLCRQWRIHTFAWHGGSLRIPEESPANKGNCPGFALDLVKEIRDAVMVVAQTPTIILSAHMPCGKAHLSAMNKYDVLEQHAAARDRLRDFIGASHVIVHPVVHIHYAERWRLGFLRGLRRKRSYFFDVELWTKATQLENAHLRLLAV